MVYTKFFTTYDNFIDLIKISRKESNNFEDITEIHIILGQIVSYLAQTLGAIESQRVFTPKYTDLYGDITEKYWLYHMIETGQEDALMQSIYVNMTVVVNLCRYINEIYEKNTKLRNIRNEYKEHIKHIIYIRDIVTAHPADTKFSKDGEKSLFLDRSGSRSCVDDRISRISYALIDISGKTFPKELEINTQNDIDAFFQYLDKLYPIYTEILMSH